MRDCAAVIPCYNESATIASLVRAVHEHVPQVWVIDDGSIDETTDLAQSAGASVLRHSRNLGKGAAIRTGLQAAFKTGFAWAFLLDGDLQHDPAEIPRFQHAARIGVDLLIGNRMEQAASMSLMRRWTNRWMSARLSRRLQLPCPDSQCGYRLVRLAAWRRVELRSNHFEIESEMLIAFARANLAIQFVPVKGLPSSRPSRIRPLVDTWRWISWWLDPPRGGLAPVLPKEPRPEILVRSR